MEKPTNNAKIMVNFFDRKVIHTFAHSGSDEYAALIQRGFVYVGQIKDARGLRIFWNPPYFDHTTKYLGTTTT